MITKGIYEVFNIPWKLVCQLLSGRQGINLSITSGRTSTDSFLLTGLHCCTNLFSYGLLNILYIVQLALSNNRNKLMEERTRLFVQLKVNDQRTILLICRRSHTSKSARLLHHPTARDHLTKFDMPDSAAAQLIIIYALDNN